MTIESSKNLGGIGAILMFIGLIPIPGAQPFLEILTLVGVILVLIALNGFANIYKDKAIINNSLYALVIGIVGAVIAGIASDCCSFNDAEEFSVSNLSQLEW